MLRRGGGGTSVRSVDLLARADFSGAFLEPDAATSRRGPLFCMEVRQYARNARIWAAARPARGQRGGLRRAKGASRVRLARKNQEARISCPSREGAGELLHPPPRR